MPYAQMTPTSGDDWTLTVHDDNGTTIDTIGTIGLAPDRYGAFAAADALLDDNGWRAPRGRYDWADKNREFTAPVVKR